MDDLKEYEMPNGEVIKVWCDGELEYGQELKEQFEYYVECMFFKYNIHIKP